MRIITVLYLGLLFVSVQAAPPAPLPFETLFCARLQVNDYVLLDGTTLCQVKSKNSSKMGNKKGKSSFAISYKQLLVGQKCKPKVYTSEKCKKVLPVVNEYQLMSINGRQIIILGEDIAKLPLNISDLFENPKPTFTKLQRLTDAFSGELGYFVTITSYATSRNQFTHFLTNWRSYTNTVWQH
jgi:translation elongation factor P/translation initiation factor 5A